MTSSIGYTSPDYNAAMDAVRADVEAYCAANSIDPDEYLAGLDSNLALNVFDREVLEPYFQLAYMQLMLILDPELINSLSASIGAPPNYETLYANADDDINQLIQMMIEDDPELMGYFANLEGGESMSDAFFEILAEEKAALAAGSPVEDTSFTEDAQALQDKYQMGETFDWIIDREESFKAAEMSILDQLSELDAFYIDIINNPSLDEKAKDSLSRNNLYQKETLLTMLQSVTTAESSFFEMMSKLYKQIQETSMGIINNWKV
ncbi:MAG: hypothetical protein HQM16_07140 [Deltaproteobacteria bacterium]|nr:hypothetical protein [Deltaproteobacteria bacterium]